MTTDPFEILIQELSASLNVPLHVDRNRACALNIHRQFTVQLQLDSAQEKLIIAAFICELAPGKFRENVLAEALKANYLPDPRTGILGYLAPQNRLTLHQHYPFASMTAQDLAMIVAGFIDYAQLWKDAIDQGQISPSPIRGSATTNPFGLKR